MTLKTYMLPLPPEECRQVPHPDPLYGLESLLYGYEGEVEVLAGLPGGEQQELQWDSLVVGMELELDHGGAGYVVECVVPMHTTRNLVLVRRRY